jgi:hypothetical protein
VLKNAVRASLLISMLSIIAVVVLASDARAVPSFARQTGFSCFMCHTVYPELKPLGREFKLTGYVISRSVKPYEFPPPLAGLVLASFTHLDGRLPSGYLDSEWSNRILSGGNDVLSIPQEANLYYAGRIYGGVGGFVQGTYEGDSNSFHLDMTDVRFARTASIGGSNLVYGITVNNSPTVQDLWNTTPAWGYPFESSDVAPRPAAGAVIDGALDQQVGGIGLYVLWNRFIYAEFTAYHTTESGIASPLGAGTETDMVVEDIAPYWRVALQHQWGEHYVSVGTYGIAAGIFPEARESGPTDTFTDVALDAEYQYLAGKSTLGLETTWVHEKQDRDASFALGDAENRVDRLNTFKVNLDYYYHAPFGHIGGTLAYFLVDGKSDRLLYAPGPVDGSRNGSPDSEGFICEADYLPLDRLKIALQYTLYNKHNGGRSNYDGFGRDASDNNTLFFALMLLL